MHRPMNFSNLWIIKINCLSERCSVLNTTTSIKSVRLIARIVAFTRLYYSLTNIVFFRILYHGLFFRNLCIFLLITILPRLLEKSKKCRGHYSITYYSTSQNDYEKWYTSLLLTHRMKSVDFKFISS